MEDEYNTELSHRADMNARARKNFERLDQTRQQII